MRQLNYSRINNLFSAVLLAPYGATAKHGNYYSGKFTLLKWDAIICLPE
jgi:hypothetical protein